VGTANDGGLTEGKGMNIWTVLAAIGNAHAQTIDWNKASADELVEVVGTGPEAVSADATLEDVILGAGLIWTCKQCVDTSSKVIFVTRAMATGNPYVAAGSVVVAAGGTIVACYVCANGIDNLQAEQREKEEARRREDEAEMRRHEERIDALMELHELGLQDTAEWRQKMREANTYEGPDGVMCTDVRPGLTMCAG